MTTQERKNLVLKAAWARHKMWCQSKESVEGERLGSCGDDRDVFICAGPKRGDISIAETLVAALFEENDVSDH